MAESAKFTNREIRNIVSALNSLDGIRRSKDSFEPYEFEDNVQWDLTKNSVIFERAKGAYDRQVKALMTKYKIVNGEAVTAENRDNVISFQAAVEALDDLDAIEVSGFLYLTLEQLRKRPARGDQKAGKNLLLVSTLKGLNPIIRDPAPAP